VERLQLLRKKLGDDTIDFKPYGGYELFLKKMRAVIMNVREITVYQ
jgi:hypothetical protein